MSTLATDIVEVRNGSLYLDARIVDACMSGAGAIALLRRDEHILMMPLLQTGGGGLILKIRNARGDRVVHAADFLGEIYPDDSASHTLRVWWSEDDGALVARITHHAE